MAENKQKYKNHPANYCMKLDKVQKCCGCEYLDKRLKCTFDPLKDIKQLQAENDKKRELLKSLAGVQG